MEDGEPVFIGTPGKGRSYFETNFPDLILPEDLTDMAGGTGIANRVKNTMIGQN